MPSSFRSAKPRAAILLAVGGTEVRFEWQGDRWGHAVLFQGVAPGPSPAAWHSIEGAVAGGEDDRWPRSPVLVEVHGHPSAGSLTVIGLGLAGRSHFSASVGPDPEVTGAIRFDMAARIQEPPVRLGSTYRSVDPDGPFLRVEPAPIAGAPLPRTVEWSYRIGPHGIEPLAGARIVPAGEGSA